MGNRQKQVRNETNTGCPKKENKYAIFLNQIAHISRLTKQRIAPLWNVRFS